MPDDPDRAALDRVLWPVVCLAVEVLTSSEIARVKECANPDDCDWLFLDSSKNNRRRWCSMEGCGSLVTMRRQTAKWRARGSGGTT